ncbi:MAG: hypothetical protein JW959_11120 [Pirellulales bacterium]|nr:hypothetical protein [Pirellulales bacterium]
MTEKPPKPPEPEYRCPGESLPISRAVHLGRLAAFYPACRECPHREDTGSLSPRQVKQLRETAAPGRPRPLFHDEGAGGMFLHDFTPKDARRIAAAFGAMVYPDTASPRVVLAGDGRPLCAELTAAAAEGIRFSGCDLIDVGPATAACLAYAIKHLQASGGVLIGNPGAAPREVGMQFWTSRPGPLSIGAGLESLARLTDADTERPARRAGGMGRFQAEVPYLATIAEHYHALRPLRVAVDSASRPLVGYLKKLAAPVACRFVPPQGRGGDPSDQIRADDAHFGVRIDGDGETCRVFDERGRAAPPEKILQLLSRFICPEAALAPLMKTRADVSADMWERKAVLGFGPGARYWHVLSGVPAPDALMTVTWLLKILSRDDAPLSAVLDREVLAV